MTSTQLAHGTIVQLSKSNATSKTAQGQWCVCILDKDAAQPGLDGTFHVFIEKEHAEAYLEVHDEWLLDTTSSSDSRPSPDEMQGFIVTLNRKKADLHHLSANWSEWCTSSGTPPLQPNDPLVGRYVEILVKNGSYRSSVVAFIQSKDADVYRLTYDNTDGVEIEVSMMAPILKEWVKRRPEALQKEKQPSDGTSSGSASAPPPPSVGYPISVNPTDLPFSYGIIKKLVVSANLSGNALDANEALAVLVARHSTRPIIDYSKVVLTHPGADVDDATGGPVDLIFDGLLSLERELAKHHDPARPRLWPSDSAKKLGEAIAALSRAPSLLPPQHPLATALKSKASSTADWSSFLGDQWMITVDQPRHFFAQSKRNDEYIMTGMLEHFLRTAGITASVIASYPDQMEASALLVLVSDMASPKAPSKPLQIPQQLQSQSPFQQAQPQNPLWTPFQQQLLQGHQQGFSVVLNEKKSSDTSRDVLQLRSDAQALAIDPLAMAELEELLKIRATGDGKALDDASKAVTSPKLKRLLASEGDDLSKQLQGALPQLTMHIDSIRCKLEERMQTAVTGGATASLTARQKLAIRHARCGHLRRLHLFHLIDEEDCGTKEAPLAQLGKWSKDKQKASLALALRQLEMILQFSTPSMVAEIMSFFSRLGSRLSSLIDAEVKHTDLSKWFKHVVDEVTKPMVKFANGDAHSGHLDFDVDKLGAARDAEESIRIAESTALAAAAIARGNSSSVPGKKAKKPEEVSGDDDSETKKGKLQKKGAPNNPHPLKEVWADKDEDLAPVHGKYLKRIKGDHPLMQQWYKDHPKKNGKGVCWMHFNLKGGCPYGDKCSNAHAK